MEKPESRAASEEPLFRTRITELYGIRLPVIASGLMWQAWLKAIAKKGQGGRE